MFDCRMLNDGDFAEVVKTMQSGFSDYMINIEIDIEGYRRKFGLEGVDLSHSVAVFAGNEMVGATVNGASVWHGVKTAYDAGTVVLPEYRRKGASMGMFEHLIPKLESSGFERYVLEVISTNEPALKLYEKLGFKKKRVLGVFKQDGVFDSNNNNGSLSFRSFELKEMLNEEIFADRDLSWQNSNEWLRRADLIGYPMYFVGAELDGKLVGVGAVAPKSGKVQRLAVDKDVRGKGIGRKLLREMAAKTEKDLVFVNLDMSRTKYVDFLNSSGFKKTIEQFEMELKFI